MPLPAPGDRHHRAGGRRGRGRRRPTSVSGFANPITYNDNGTLATIQHANGALFTQTPDLSGMPRPGSLRVDGTAQGWPREDYFYDGAGNIKAIGGKSFVYDVESRIVAATVPTDVAQPYQAYAYDGFDNLKTIYSGTGPGNVTWLDYTADRTTNRLTGAMYENSGELTSYQSSSYTWDVLGQVTSVNTGSELWTHTYDAKGERVWSWRTSPSRLDTYALRGQDKNVLSLFTKTGSAYTWEDYAYREGVVFGAVYSNATTYHFDVDHLGSVRLETPGLASQPTYYRDLWPYGDEATPPSSPERMRFAGQERDLGNLTSIVDDIDYMHARYYRPIFGRFLSVDLAEPKPESSPAWNRYSYGKGNPLRFADPTGEDVWDVINGFANGLFSDLALGQGRQAAPNADYAFGQRGGDIAAAAGSLIEINQGLATLAGSTLVTAGTLGTSTVVTGPTAVLGGLEAAHGIGVLVTASSMLGKGGTQVISKTLYDQDGIRVDVENPAPGKRPGRIQVHSGDDYWHYNPDTNSLEGDPPNAVKRARAE